MYFYSTFQKQKSFSIKTVKLKDSNGQNNSKIKLKKRWRKTSEQIHQLRKAKECEAVEMKMSFELDDVMVKVNYPEV